MYKGGHGPFMHLPQAPDIRNLKTGTVVETPAADLASRNLSNPRRESAPPPLARPAQDSVQAAIHGIIERK